MTEAVPPSRPRARRKRWWIAGGLVIAALCGWWLAFSRPPVRPGTFLLLDLGDAVEERAREGFFQIFSGSSSPDVVDLWRALDLAAKDPRVEGLLLRVKPGRVGPGKVDELRGLVERFRAAGKIVVAHDSAPDTLGYFLSTAADEVLLDRSTTLDAVGIRLSAFFLKDALAKLGVEPDLVRIGDFKGAYEELALNAPTPELEESMNAIVDSVYESIVQGIAGARKLDESGVRQLLDRCPLPPDEALAEKLVDRVVDAPQVLARLEERAGKEVHLSTISNYLGSSGVGSSGGRRLALVHVLGAIVEGDSRDLPLAGFSAGADTVARALRDAAADPAVAGILLRIDSPGGVVSASEKIFRAVSEARKQKPLVASLGGAAASGGYYAACGAEKIFAHPTTFTGSIGVFGGKVVITELLAQHRVESRTYARGKRAGMSDFTRRYTLEERLALKALLEDAYRRFVDAVALGRKKTFEEIHAVAQGRVWTGRAAVGAGLVDGIGGIDEALQALRGLAHIAATDPIDVQLYPPRATVWSVFARSRAGEEPLASAAARWGFDASSADLLEHAASLRDAGLLDGFARLALMPCFLTVR